MSGINSSSVYSHFVEMYTNCISKIYSMIMTEKHVWHVSKNWFLGCLSPFGED